MRIQINGKTQTFPMEEAFLSEILAKLNLPKEGIAVCVNLQLVSKEDWLGHVLHSGDEIDIVSASPGG